jgi:hypothetical protein
MRSGGTDSSKEDSSFLKKRNKKLLFPGRYGPTARAQTNKVFLLLFLQKKKNPYFPSSG